MKIKRTNFKLKSKKKKKKNFLEFMKLNDIHFDKYK